MQNRLRKKFHIMAACLTTRTCNQFIHRQTCVDSHMGHNGHCCGCGRVCVREGKGTKRANYTEMFSECLPHQKELCKHLSHDRFSDFQSCSGQVLVLYGMQLLHACPISAAVYPLYQKQMWIFITVYHSKFIFVTSVSYEVKLRNCWVRRNKLTVKEVFGQCIIGHVLSN